MEQNSDPSLGMPADPSLPGERAASTKRIVVVGAIAVGVVVVLAIVVLAIVLLTKTHHQTNSPSNKASDPESDSKEETGQTTPGSSAASTGVDADTKPVPSAAKLPLLDWHPAHNAFGVDLVGVDPMSFEETRSVTSEGCDIQDDALCYLHGPSSCNVTVSGTTATPDFDYRRNFQQIGTDYDRVLVVCADAKDTCRRAMHWTVVTAQEMPGAGANLSKARFFYADGERLHEKAYLLGRIRASMWFATLMLKEVAETITPDEKQQLNVLVNTEFQVPKFNLQFARLITRTGQEASGAPAMYNVVPGSCALSAIDGFDEVYAMLVMRLANATSDIECPNGVCAIQGRAVAQKAYESLFQTIQFLEIRTRAMSTTGAKNLPMDAFGFEPQFLAVAVCYCGDLLNGVVSGTTVRFNTVAASAWCAWDNALDYLAAQHPDSVTKMSTVADVAKACRQFVLAEAVSKARHKARVHMRDMNIWDEDVVRARLDTAQGVLVMHRVYDSSSNVDELTTRPALTTPSSLLSSIHDPAFPRPFVVLDEFKDFVYEVHDVWTNAANRSDDKVALVWEGTDPLPFENFVA